MKPPPKLAARLRNRRNVIQGAQAEEIVGYRLRQAGFLCVQRIETGWRVQRAKGRIIGASPLAKVAADFTAVAPGGRSVRVEVKRRPAKLYLRDFQPHSIRALDEHEAAGGRTLVAWQCPGKGVAIFDWSAFKQHAPMAWKDTEMVVPPQQAEWRNG